MVAFSHSPLTYCTLKARVRLCLRMSVSSSSIRVTRLWSQVAGGQGVPIGPQAGQGRQGSLPYWLGANWHNLDISNIQTGGHLAHLGHQQP